MIEPVILDASALLAAFKGEKGSEAVTATSGKAMMSAVNVLILSALMPNKLEFAQACAGAQS
jgi:PIN domain nuclease of toxin-antitoxin system